MLLVNTVGKAMTDAVQTAIGANGRIQFYTQTTDLPTAGGAGTNILSNGLGVSSTPFSGTASNATYVTRTFGPITTDTVAAGGNRTAIIFAILNTSATTCTSDAIVLTGSVGTNAGDIQFNTNVWTASDNVAITALTFTQPL
jgi:hypothetical protein